MTGAFVHRPTPIATRLLIVVALWLPLSTNSGAALAGSGRPTRIKPVIQQRLGGAATRARATGSAMASPFKRIPVPARAKAVAARAKATLKRIPRKVKIATAAALVVATAVGGFYLHADSKNREWKSSPAHGVVVQVEKAVTSRDAAALDRLGDGARAKYVELERQIADARARGHNELADGMSLDAAERELDFTGLAMSLADLEENVISGNSEERPGVTLPSAWQNRIGSAEAGALSRGFEGDLALQLSSLRSELTAENSVATSADRAIDEFGHRVPVAFGGEMRADLDQARRALSRFHEKEISPERTLHQRANTAMRGRVSDRLASESTEFAGHRTRLGRLSTLQDRMVDPAATLAAEIDADLGSVISHRSAERNYLAIAATKTAVPVTKTRTACCRTETVNGQTRSVSYTETYTAIEDQSGVWRAMAASEASAAQSAARSAQQGLDRLRPLIVKLHNDSTLQGEGLVSLLPDGANTQVDTGHGAMSDWFLPPLFNLFSNAGSQASAARTEFRPVLTSLVNVNTRVGSLRGTERTWVESRIDSDLDQQIAQAQRGEG